MLTKSSNPSFSQLVVLSSDYSFLKASKDGVKAAAREAKAAAAAAAREAKAAFTGKCSWRHCCDEFETVKDLDDHLITHAKAESIAQGFFICGCCDEVFMRNCGLVHHTSSQSLSYQSYDVILTTLCYHNSVHSGHPRHVCECGEESERFYTMRNHKSQCQVYRYGRVATEAKASDMRLAPTTHPTPSVPTFSMSRMPMVDLRRVTPTSSQLFHFKPSPAQSASLLPRHGRPTQPTAAPAYTPTVASMSTSASATRRPVEALRDKRSPA